MDTCLFCRIVTQEVPSSIVYEDAKTLAFLDIHPVNQGHVLVIPKEHSSDILATSREALHAVMNTIQKITPAVLAAVSSPAFNIGVNTGSIAGQVVPHTHFHIMPRFEADGRDLWSGNDIADAEREAIAADIRSRLV